MTLHVDIRKKLGDFHLEAAFDAGAEPLALLGAEKQAKPSVQLSQRPLRTVLRGSMVKWWACSRCS